MKGYKAFKYNLTCRNHQFDINNSHVFHGVPILCKKGYHFCTILEDVVKYYHHPDMRVFEIEATGIITDANSDCSNRACSEIKLVKEIPLNEVMLSITKSENAFWWAMGIGNKDIMINLINDSKYAYDWARYIGNTNIMKSRITKPHWITIWNYWFTGKLDKLDIGET